MQPRKPILIYSESFPRFLNAASMAGTFIFTCVALQTFLPHPEIAGVSGKLRRFQSSPGEFDTLFVGSSRVYHEISPGIFDDVMRSRDMATRSFNFGIDGMHLPESFYVLDLILKTKPQGLKWVFIEFDDLQVTPWPGYQGTQRLLYWHDWTRTSLVVRKLLNLNVYEKPKRKIQRAAKYWDYLSIHLALFSKKFGNAGSISDLIRERLREPESPGQGQVLGPRGDGYFSGDTQLSGGEKTAYEQALAGVTEPVKPRVIDRYADEAYRICAKKVRQSGAIPIFVVTPVVSVSPVRFQDNAPAPGSVLAFNEAKAFPQLYRTNVRINEGHVNKKGAEEFTRLLAEKFAHEVATHTIR
jgi:hypothetical protein